MLNWNAAAEEHRTRGLLSRKALLDDLEEALVPGSGPLLLVMFELGGLREILTSLSAEEGDALLVRLARRFSDEIGRDARSYESRRDQLIALVPARGGDPSLERARTGLAEAAAPHRLEIVYGAALLPDEARTPVEALERADERLFVSRLTRGRDRRDARRVAAGLRGLPSRESRA